MLPAVRSPDRSDEELSDKDLMNATAPRVMPLHRGEINSRRARQFIGGRGKTAPPPGGGSRYSKKDYLPFAASNIMATWSQLMR